MVNHQTAVRSSDSASENPAVKQTEPDTALVQTPQNNLCLDLSPDKTVQSEQTIKENQRVPYNRFKEVIDERNQLREELDSLAPTQPVSQNQPEHKNETLSEDKLNLMWDENPSHTMKVMFSQMVSDIQKNERLSDRYLSETIDRYPEITDSNHQMAIMTKEILHNEIPEMMSDPKGISIAVELAAARYYKNRLDNMEETAGFKNLEATRSINLKNAYIEHGSKTSSKKRYSALSAQEQHIAKMMGVPLDKYATQKTQRGR